MAGEAYTQYSVKYLVFFDTKSLLSHLEAKEVRSVRWSGIGYTPELKGCL